MLFLVLIGIIGLVLLDTSTIKIYYVNTNQLPIYAKMILFFIIGSISIFGQWLILQYVKKRWLDAYKMDTLHFKTLYPLIVIGQSILTGTLILIMLQMIFDTKYYVFFLIVSISVSQLIGSVTLAVLSQKFFSWFRSDRNSVVFSYGISFAIITVNLVFGAIIVVKALSEGSQIIRPHFAFVTPYTEMNFFTFMLYSGYTISSILGFISAWISTILLLRQFSLSWGGKAHWPLLVIPLAYFLIQFQPFFLSLFSAFGRSDPVLYNIFYTLFISFSALIGGLIFGGAFWTMTRNLRKHNIQIDYTIISAYGFILLFISNQVFVLSSAPYPPFGLATTNFLAIASFMLLSGIYSSAISVAVDGNLRKSIRRMVEKKSNLLGSIGSSQMSQNLEKLTIKLYDQTVDKFEEVGVTPTISVEEAKDYCRKIIDEIDSREKR